jgi:uncharacterized membrane protein (DUF106 family)
MKEAILKVVERTIVFARKLYGERPLLAMFLFGVLTGLFISFVF